MFYFDKQGFNLLKRLFFNKSISIVRGRFGKKVDICAINLAYLCGGVYEIKRIKRIDRIFEFDQLRC